MNKPLIIILNSSSFGLHFPEHIKRLKQFAEIKSVKVPADIHEKDLLNELQGANGIIASVTPQITKFVIENLIDLHIIARHGIGCDNVDIEAATRQGIYVSKVAGLVEKEAVAELSLSLTLAAARHIVSGATAVKEGLWSSRASFIGLELKEKQVGLIGLGNIGSRVAEIFGVGFKSKVVAYDPHLSSKQFSNLGVTSLPLEELLSSSDIISLHCPLTEATKRILDRERISKMKPGAILINTCRGELLDQTALIERLTSKQLRVYATDVVEGEPIDNNHPLLSLNNVIVLPHLGGYTEQSLFGMGETMVNDCENVFVNKTTPNTLANPNVLSSERKRWA